MVFQAPVALSGRWHQNKADLHRLSMLHIGLSFIFGAEPISGWRRARIVSFKRLASPFWK
jgi:hypothetical protein